MVYYDGWFLMINILKIIIVYYICVVSLTGTINNLNYLIYNNIYINIM